MCFYIYQVNPPTPWDSDVEISEPAEDMLVYVHTFGGNATQDTDLNQAKKFADMLTSVGEEVSEDHFYTASYNDPTKSLNRKNEVMFLVQSSRYD